MSRSKKNIKLGFNGLCDVFFPTKMKKLDLTRDEDEEDIIRGC